MQGPNLVYPRHQTVQVLLAPWTRKHPRKAVESTPGSVFMFLFHGICSLICDSPLSFWKSVTTILPPAPGRLPCDVESIVHSRSVHGHGHWTDFLCTPLTGDGRQVGAGRSVYKLSGTEHVLSVHGSSVQVSLEQEKSVRLAICVQVSPIWPIIRPIPEDLSRTPRPDTHFGVQARLVHHGIIWKRAKEPQLINYSLSVSSTTGKKASPPQSIHGRKLFNGVLFAGFERESLYSCSDKTDLTNQ